MPEIVFIEPNKMDSVPFTTSKVMAECAKIKHRAIQQMILKYEKTLNAFGALAR